MGYKITFKQYLTSLNSEFELAPKLKNIVYPTILLLAEGG